MKKMTKKIFILVLIVTFALVFALFFIKYVRSKQKIVEEETTPEFRNLCVRFVETGWVEPRNRVKIIPPFSGRIEKIFVDEGDKIKKGQMIALISSNERAAMTDAARVVSQKEYVRWQNIMKPVPIFAPMDGFVILRDKQPGQTIVKDDAIVVMADDLIINIYINEIDIRHVKIGDVLEVYLETYPERPFFGIVERISYECRVVDNVVVYPVYVKPIEKLNFIQSGMTAIVTIITEYKKNILSIPNSFITENGKLKIVTVKIKTLGKTKFIEREIKIGITNGVYTEILEGLHVNDVIIKFKSLHDKNNK
jgi:macrolide-specific efflux system membrane fusion protein